MRFDTPFGLRTGIGRRHGALIGLHLRAGGSGRRSDCYSPLRGRLR